MRNKLTILERIVLMAIICLLVCNGVDADTFTKNIIIQEVDGSPKGKLNILQVSNDTLTKNSEGNYSFSPGSGSGNGTPGGSSGEIQYRVDATTFGGVTGVNNTEAGYLDGVTSAIQTQLNNKLDDSQLDDTKGNGDTAYVWSADKVFDQLALKQAADSDLNTWAGITPGANVGTFLATPSSANFFAAITDESGSGAVLGQEAPTINNATMGGVMKVDHIAEATSSHKIVFDNVISTASNIQSVPNHWRFNILNPEGFYTNEAHYICIIPKVEAALTVTNIEVNLDADPTTEIDCDLVYADTYIGKANEVIINALDTTAGVLSDNTITSGAVPAGKAVYLKFNAAPDTATHDMAVDVTWDYD